MVCFSSIRIGLAIARIFALCHAIDLHPSAPLNMPVSDSRLPAFISSPDRLFRGQQMKLTGSEFSVEKKISYQTQARNLI